MSVILLADDSAHAQRIGESILREEGFEVTSATDGNMALAAIAHDDPDLVIADAFLPGRNGFDLCRLIKSYRPYIRVVLTVGLLEHLDEEEAKAAGCDAVLHKPFEASVAARIIRPLIEEARRARGESGTPMSPGRPVSDALGYVPPDPRRVEAAVAAALDDVLRRALDEAMEQAIPGLVQTVTQAVTQEVTHRVLLALSQPAAPPAASNGRR